jgi:hypothetical protein
MTAITITERAMLSSTPINPPIVELDVELPVKGIGSAKRQITDFAECIP